jgi:hypothetical protein
MKPMKELNSELQGRGKYIGHISSFLYRNFKAKAKYVMNEDSQYFKFPDGKESWGLCAN